MRASCCYHRVSTERRLWMTRTLPGDLSTKTRVIATKKRLGSRKTRIPVKWRAACVNRVQRRPSVKRAVIRECE